jgi:hypothetical protein
MIESSMCACLRLMCGSGGESATALLTENNLQRAGARGLDDGVAPLKGWEGEEGLLSSIDNVRPSWRGGAAQKGIASMGGGNEGRYGEKRAPHQHVKDSISGILQQLENQQSQPRRDEVLPAIFAAAVLLAFALYPLLRPVVSLFSKEDSSAAAKDATEEARALQSGQHEPTHAHASRKQSPSGKLQFEERDALDHPPHVRWPGGESVALVVVVWLDDDADSYAMRFMIYIYMYICMYIYIYIYHMYMYIYVYIYI